MPNEWCYEIDGEFHGPVPWEELRRLARTGRIGPTTMLRRGRGEWLVARHVPGVFEGVAAEPAPDDEPAGRFDDPRVDRPIRRLGEPEVDEDYRLPPPRGAGGGFVTAYGAVTLVLAGLLTLTGCLSGAGSLMFFSWFNAMQSAPSPSTGSSGCNGFFAAIFWGLAIVLAIVTAVHLILAGGHFTVGIGVLGRRAWAPDSRPCGFLFLVWLRKPPSLRGRHGGDTGRDALPQRSLLADGCRLFRRAVRHPRRTHLGRDVPSRLRRRIPAGSARSPRLLPRRMTVLQGGTMSASPAAAPAAPLPSCLLLFLRLLAVALAAVQAWGGRFLIKPDGVSYLDIADAYLRGDWRNAVSTYWSPLYSWLLCRPSPSRPPPLWEFPIVKIVNFAIFLAVLAAFEWFARRRRSRARPARRSRGRRPAAQRPLRLRLWAVPLVVLRPHVAAGDFAGPARVGRRIPAGGVGPAAPPRPAGASRVSRVRADSRHRLPAPRRPSCRWACCFCSRH